MIAMSDRIKFVKRALVAVLLLVGAGYAAACAYLWTQQRALIFLPESVVRRTPTAIGIDFRELNIAVNNRGVINAWWLPADPGLSAAVAVLYFHGNDGNLGSELERLDTLHRLGLPILAVDYRGYGNSSGPAPSESNVYEDAVAAWDHLVRVDAFHPKRIVLYGHSLGAAVAVELALRRAPACGIVLESTFTSMAAMARSEYPLVPVDWLLEERFDTLDKISRLALPMLFVHGMNDDIVPAGMTEELFRAAREPKQLFLVHAGHENALQKGGQRVAQAIAEFARRCGNDGS
jgi:pimeloyl-ACP methyl ester carboxylesterase